MVTEECQGSQSSSEGRGRLSDDDPGGWWHSSLQWKAIHDKPHQDLPIKDQHGHFRSKSNRFDVSAQHYFQAKKILGYHTNVRVGEMSFDDLQKKFIDRMQREKDRSQREKERNMSSNEVIHSFIHSKNPTQLWNIESANIFSKLRTQSEE